MQVARFRLCQKVRRKLKPKTIFDRPFSSLHCTPVAQAFQMKETVDKERKDEFLRVLSEVWCLPSRFGRTNKYLAALFLKRKREHVRRLVFAAVMLVQGFRARGGDE